ncbi:hypothetical protein [Loigolactobacillus zhaoyuanensis]|uniref:hypothetical protein n=1 Tax=Loigolactobacillus zhaoyuanensis TaxID=2486017 RepID=UPI000F74836F|nr:hypothetical protein [Loigolactobacillus zhaoyuanensis]
MQVGYIDSFYDLPQLDHSVRFPWRAYYPAQKAGMQAPIMTGKFPLILALNLTNTSSQALAAAGNIVCQLQFPNRTAVTPTDYPQWLTTHQPLVAANKQAVKQSLLVVERLLAPRQINSAHLQAHILLTQVGACGQGFGGSVALELLRRSHLITAASATTNFLASQKWNSPCAKPQLLLQTVAAAGLTPIFKRARKRAYLYTSPQPLSAETQAQLNADFFATSFAQRRFSPPAKVNWLCKS